jgi:hypothetical protein
MLKGIIRVPDDLDLSHELENALKTQFPGYVLEHYSLTPDYCRSFSRRVEILRRAFGYMLDSYPYEKKTSSLPYSLLNDKELLKAYAMHCGAEYEIQTQNVAQLDDKSKVEKLQAELRIFTSKLNEAIAQLWHVPTHEAAELLNEAEQYELMVEGREDLVTVSSIVIGNEVKYSVQYDQILPPHYPQIINELEHLKAIGYPKTPVWFRALRAQEFHYMQTFFCNMDPKISDVKEDFCDFLKTWDNITKKAIHFPNDLAVITKKKNLLLPDWFNKLPSRYQEMIRLLATDPLPTINQKLQQLKLFIDEQDSTFTPQFLAQLPHWYWVLPEHQQYFLEHALKSKNNVEEAVFSLSSRHRMLPMPANYGIHKLLLLSKDGKFKDLYSEKRRSSHIASRDGIKWLWPLSVMRYHALVNMLKVMEGVTPEQEILLQTLVSPVGSDAVPSLSSIVPDYELVKIANSIIEEGAPVPPVMFRNLPLNIAKLFLYSTADNSYVEAFLKTVEPYCDAIDGLKELIDNYKRVLNSDIGTATYREYREGLGRELFLSSLEQLIILKIGGYSYGCCVSGKDRKAIELIHTDAMYLYHEKFGVWPEFDDLVYNRPCRADFVSIVADLYLSRHQHEHAGQNAPGSEGIKTSAQYLPADIAKEINRRLYGDEESKKLRVKTTQIDDRLATNNEVKMISTTGMSKGVDPHSTLSAEDILLCRMLATKLGQKRCGELYDGLFVLLSKQQLFSTVIWDRFFKIVRPPTGISKIKSLMDSENSGDKISRVAGILELLLDRPEEGALRKEATIEVYKLRDLLTLKVEEKNVDEIIDQFSEERVAKWKDLFEKSKLQSEVAPSTYINCGSIHV